MNRLGLLLRHFTIITVACPLGVLANCGKNDVFIPSVHIGLSTYYIEVTVINETSHVINLNPNLRLFREINLVIRNQKGDEVELKKFADVEFDPDNFGDLSPGSYIGIRINYNSLAQYVSIDQGCYSVKALYGYMKNKGGNLFQSVESDETTLCLRRNENGLELME